MSLLELTNKDITKVLRFLQKVKITGKASRGRSRLVSKLGVANSIADDEKYAVVREYIVIGEDGNFKRNEDDSDFLLKDGKTVEEFNIKYTEIEDDVINIDVTELEHFLLPLYKALDSYDEELDYNDGEAYDLIMTKLEQLNLKGSEENE